LGKNDGGREDEVGKEAAGWLPTTRVTAEAWRSIKGAWKHIKARRPLKAERKKLVQKDDGHHEERTVGPGRQKQSKKRRKSGNMAPKKRKRRSRN